VTHILGRPHARPTTVASTNLSTSPQNFTALAVVARRWLAITKIESSRGVEREELDLALPGACSNLSMKAISGHICFHKLSDEGLIKARLNRALLFLLSI
jgi:hypothetical protein